MDFFLFHFLYVSYLQIKDKRFSFFSWSSLRMVHNVLIYVWLTEKFFSYFFTSRNGERDGDGCEESREWFLGWMLINVSFAHWCTLHILYMRMKKDSQIQISKLLALFQHFASILHSQAHTTPGTREWEWKNWCYLSCI